MLTEKSRGMGLALFLLSVWLLFHALGSAALFEPDEGRYAEVGREILILKDWVTPHYNFIPRLDKPPLFSWLVALAYKIFGVSEWSARLPSALAALGLVLLTSWFGWSRTAPAGAWWSGLILLTCVETMALGRTAIPDMVLTFFVTLALSSFFWGSQAEKKPLKRRFYLMMYGALGAAVLAKGLVGLVLPALVILSYLLWKRKWTLLREMDIIAGAVIVSAVAAPWYLLAEMRHPGYLRYFLWEEHFLRYFTAHFNRSQPWHYFLVVGAVGFLPWSLFLPITVKKLCTGDRDDQTTYLLTWIVLPFLFFSLSDSKLPHYIFPIFPPLAVLTGKSLAAISSDRSKSWLFSLPWLIFVLPSLFLAAAFLHPDLLPRRLLRSMERVFQTISLSHVLSGLLVASVLFLLTRTLARGGGRALHLTFCIGFALLSFSTIEPIRAQVSLGRSSKELALKSSDYIRSDDPVVIYDARLTSLPFYLGRNQPLHIVQAGGKKDISVDSYMAWKLRAKGGPDGIVLHPEEFSEFWKRARQRIFVFVLAKELNKLMRHTGNQGEIIVRVKDVLLVSNRRAAGLRNDL